MEDKATPMLNLLKDEYGLRVRLSEGVSAKLIGPVHRIYLTIDKKEERYHLGDKELEDLVIFLAKDKLGIDFKPSDMPDLKKQLKAMAVEPMPPEPME
jgi:hypothetical protein